MHESSRCRLPIRRTDQRCGFSEGGRVSDAPVNPCNWLAAYSPRSDKTSQRGGVVVKALWCVLRCFPLSFVSSDVSIRDPLSSRSLFVHRESSLVATLLGAVFAFCRKKHCALAFSPLLFPRSSLISSGCYLSSSCDPLFRNSACGEIGAVLRSGPISAPFEAARKCVVVGGTACD